MNAYMNWHIIHASCRRKRNSPIFNYTTKKPGCQWELTHFSGILVIFCDLASLLMDLLQKVKE